jgi:hypothetical protein
MPGRFFIASALLAGIPMLQGAERPRIYITESGVTEIEAENINLRKGTSSENIEVMKSFLKECPGVIVTSNRDKANYIVRFDRDSPSPITPFVKGNKVAVFDREDDLVFSESTRYLSSAVKSTCSAVLKHAASKR